MTPFELLALERAYLHLLALPHGPVRLMCQGAMCHLRNAIAEEKGWTPQRVQDDFEWQAGLLRQPQ